MKIKNLIFDLLIIVLMILGILNELGVLIPSFIIIIPLSVICIVVQVYRIIVLIKNKNQNKK